MDAAAGLSCFGGIRGRLVELESCIVSAPDDLVSRSEMSRWVLVEHARRCYLVVDVKCDF